MARPAKQVLHPGANAARDIMWQKIEAKDRPGQWIDQRPASRIVMAANQLL